MLCRNFTTEIEKYLPFSSGCDIAYVVTNNINEMEPTQNVTGAPNLQQQAVIINTAPAQFVRTEAQLSYKRKLRRLAVSKKASKFLDFSHPFPNEKL